MSRVCVKWNLSTCFLRWSYVRTSDSKIVKRLRRWRCDPDGMTYFTFHKRDFFQFSFSHTCTSRSWLAMLHRSLPMGFLFQTLYNIAGSSLRFTLYINLLFFGTHDLQTRLSNKDLARNAWNRHWGISMAGTARDLITPYETYDFLELGNILWHLPKAWLPIFFFNLRTFATSTSLLLFLRFL